MEYAIDVGGTKIACGVTDAGSILAEDELATAHEPPDDQLRRVGAKLRRMAADRGVQPDVAGLSLPGPVTHGILRRGPNLHHAWQGHSMTDFAAMLGLGVPLAGQRDACLGGVGEYAYGAGDGRPSFAYLTLGTGVGGALILDGEPLIGHAGAAGEIGHLSVDPQGPQCHGCGRRGCVEAYASGPAIARNFTAKTGREADTREVARLAREGDDAARSVVREAAEALASACASWAQVANPEAVVVGGSLVAMLDLLEPMIGRSLEQKAWSANLPLPLLPAALGGPAPMLGAAFYARRRKDAGVI